METTVLKVEEIECVRDMYQDDEGRYFYDWRRWDTTPAGFLELRKVDTGSILSAIQALHHLSSGAYCKEKYPGSWEVFSGEHKPLYKINIW